MDERRQQARTALEALLADYRDVFGPQCWCGPPGDEGDEHERGGPPCPNIAPTVGLSAWVLAMEYSDLDPDAPLSGVSYEERAGQSPNLSKGIHQRAAERY